MTMRLIDNHRFLEPVGWDLPATPEPQSCVLVVTVTKDGEGISWVKVKLNRSMSTNASFVVTGGLLTSTLALERAVII